MIIVKNGLTASLPESAADPVEIKDLFTAMGAVRARQLHGALKACTYEGKVDVASVQSIAEMVKQFSLLLLVNLQLVALMALVWT